MTVDNIIKIGALCTAVTGIYIFISKVVLWMNNQKQQDEKIKELHEKHDRDMHNVNEEMQLITYGLLSVLKAYRGDETNVNDAIDKIEKHLNAMAHK